MQRNKDYGVECGKIGSPHVFPARASVRIFCTIHIRDDVIIYTQKPYREKGCSIIRIGFSEKYILYAASCFCHNTSVFLYIFFFLLYLLRFIHKIEVLLVVTILLAIYSKCGGL